MAVVAVVINGRVDFSEASRPPNGPSNTHYSDPPLSTAKVLTFVDLDIIACECSDVGRILTSRASLGWRKGESERARVRARRG